jgi:hypothetical protein
MLIEYLQVFVQLVIKTVIQLMGDKFAMSMMIEMLESVAKTTETTLDDEIIKLIKQQMLLKAD